MRPSPSATLASVDDLSGIRGDSTGMMRGDSEPSGGSSMVRLSASHACCCAVSENGGC